MLQTIEVEIDANGNVHPVEATERLPAGRALLTLLSKTAVTGTLQAPTKGLESLFGILKAKEGISLEAMDAAIRRRAEARFHDRD